MTTKVSERVASWSVNEDGIATFKYEIDGKKFTFCVTPDTMQAVLRDIGKLAAHPALPLTWNDAAYLTAMIRDVVLRRNVSLWLRRFDLRYNGIIGWAIMMMCCSATFCVALFVFFVWGW